MAAQPEVIPGAQPSEPRKPSSNEAGNAMRSLPRATLVRLLQTCLDSCPMVGLSEAMLTSWLDVATERLRHYPDFAVVNAIGLTIGRYDHPARILPLLIDAIEAEVELERSRAALASTLAAKPRRIEPPARPRVPRLTEDELQHLAPTLRRVGLARGWIAEDETGRLSWTDVAPAPAAIHPGKRAPADEASARTWREQQEAFDANLLGLEQRAFTQAQVDTLPEFTKRVGAERDWLWELRNGRFAIRPADPDSSRARARELMELGLLR